MTSSAVKIDASDLAPISISVYTRIDHFRRCVESLAANSLAEQSVLYIFSDAPRPGDESDVARVRQYAETIKGFKQVVLVFQETNDYLRNVKEARELPLKRHGSIIRMEDDNLTSKNFLEFMNQALILYRDDPDILSVSGYCPPINQFDYVEDDVYLSRLFSGWTLGTWAHKPFLSFLASEKPYADMVENELASEVALIHPTLGDALKRMDDGLHEAGDQKLSYHMIKHKMYQLKPVKSLVQNIGHDGTGVHCKHSDKFDAAPFDGKLSPGLRDRKYLPALDRLQYSYFHQDRFASKALRKIKRIIS